MNRRELLGAGLVIALVALGRLLRQRLLLAADGDWREPGWLEARLPPLAGGARDAAAARPRRPAGPLDPNTCPADSLELLPGIGPALAGRIVAARRRGVHFACARDLQEIRGIGSRLAARLEPYLAFVAGDSADTATRQSASAPDR